MSEHPMITAMREARLIAANKGDDIAVCNAALQWLSDPANLSEDVLETVVKEVDVSVGLILPCKVKATITALANALIKEIEALKGGAS